MNTMWLDEPPMYGFKYDQNHSQESIPVIKNWRRTEFVDFQWLDRMTRMKTYDIFGDVDPARVSVQGITERNTLFVHMLMWDVRYNDIFYKRIIDAVFISSVRTTHVIIVMPPWVTPVGFVEENMTRIVPNGQTDSYRVQALYVGLRHMHCPRLRIRRVVEEDNDDIIPILDRESDRFKELYGEFYISEMMRYPDGVRQTVVAEADGLVTGVLCLNKIVDVQPLDQHFELGPYHGLRKPHPGDEIPRRNDPQFASPILSLVATEIDDKDHSNVKPVYKTSAFRPEEDIDGNYLSDSRERTDYHQSECGSRHNDGDICGKAYSNAPCPSCEETWRNPAIGISTDVGTNAPMFRGSRSSLSSIEETRAPAFEFDLTDTEAPVSASQRSGNRTPDDAHFGAKTASIIPSRINLGLDSNEPFLADEETRSEDLAAEIDPPNSIRKDTPPPVYRGEINAFTLELFSMREDVDERLSHDYLEAAFECFPEEDYCVLLIPPCFPTFPLLQSFVRVPLRFNQDYPLVMYLAHRASVIGELKTRDADVRDTLAAEELLVDVPKRSQVLKDFKLSFDIRSPYRAYVFSCEGTVVGFAILCVEREIELIRSRYRIDDFVSFERSPADSHARIIHLTIMPIFASLHRYFLQELMHLGDKRALYYRLYHNDAGAMNRGEPLVTFLGEMIPVLPRRKFKYSSYDCPEIEPANLALRDIERNNFALYMIVPRVAGTPKADVNVRVVVIGASECGLSVLETLVFGRNATSISLTNITLVSPDGIPFEDRPDDLVKDELPYGGRCARDYRHLVGLRAWINVVHGTVTAIHRKDKVVTVSNAGSLSYDYLILTCGLQYQRPKFFEELRAEKKGDLRDYPNPKNCLTINTERDAADCLSYCLRLLAENSSCSVIFYGQNIDSYSALTMLVDSGIPAGNVTLLEPGVKICEDQNTTFFGNDEVEEAVLKAGNESGLNFMSGWDLVDWTLEEDDKDLFVRSLTLERKGDRRELACDVLFNFRKKTINTDTFLAICRSGLVFDGSLVIDPEFETNDPCIFAAGTITKYSRRFYANDSSHNYYNPSEVGERLGQRLRTVIEPRNVDDYVPPTEISTLDMILPVFKKPMITSCRLPGGYYYLDVRKPGKFITDETSDVVLTTGFPSSNVGYFRIRLDQFDTVQTITCLSRMVLEVENYVSLYGKHQTLLNDLKIRFQKSMVPDLYAYFREPWAAAIFSDRFDCLRVESRATLLSSTVVGDDTLIHDCTKALIKSKWEAMRPEDRKLIETRYAGSVYQEELENCLIDFLQYSEIELPMYCNPRFVRQFLYDVELLRDDPLFRETNSH